LVSLRQLVVLSLGIAALIGCGGPAEKLPDEAVTSTESRIAEIKNSNMPEPAKQAAIARIQTETENAKSRGNK